MKALIAILLLSVIPLLSQKIYPKQQVGLGYSLYSGAGLSYLIEFNPTYAAKASGFIYYYGEDLPDVVEIYPNIGFEFQRNIYKNPNSRLYALAGLSYWYFENRNKTVKFENDREIITRTININEIFNYGLGIGFEHKFVNQFSISADIGLHYQTSGITNFSPIFDRNPKGTEFIGIGASLGFRYNF